jgi:L-lactate dehydrogenase complex protein LldF
MQPASRHFKANASAALADEQLQRALLNIRRGFVVKRAAACEALPEFDALKSQAREIKEHTLAHLDVYLEEYERQVTASGGHVHWAADAEEARRIITDLCREAGARTVTKGKSMIAEEISLNSALEAAGLEVTETDLGEYIIQLRNEAPSHIIAPAVHLTRQQIEADFRRMHTALPQERTLDEPADLVAEARAVLREKFLSADAGITGANFLIAETGSSVIVTNEGNGDLTQILPRIHIVIASIEKLVPTLEDASAIIRLLARSATGQEISTYTTFSTGPRREGDPDGPLAYHVVLLDNGRTEMLGSEFHDMLRCIRCGACLNHCPVYNAVGGHAYGWVYPGPMGAVLTPHLIGIQEAGHLPNASTFCGRCESVCPMEIPLTKMMRHWREREFSAGKTSRFARFLLRTWAFLAKRPELYHWMMQLPPRILALLAGRDGRVRKLPLAGGWFRHRDFPAPQGPTFQAIWFRQQLETEAAARRAAKKGGA